MAQRITIDPITRIEGHLRIEVEVAGGKVTNAWSSGADVQGNRADSCRAGIPVTPIILCNAPAGSERTPMLCPR
jgi:hypothetical protein